MIYGRSNLGGKRRLATEGKPDGIGIEPGCYIMLSQNHEWDNAIESLLLAVDALNFAEDCEGISQFDKNTCRRYANKIYDLIDRIESTYRPDPNVLPERITRIIQMNL